MIIKVRHNALDYYECSNFKLICEPYPGKPLEKGEKEVEGSSHYKLVLDLIDGGNTIIWLPPECNVYIMENGKTIDHFHITEKHIMAPLS